MKRLFSKYFETIFKALLPLVLLLIFWYNHWLTDINVSPIEGLLMVITVYYSSAYYKYLMKKVTMAIWSHDNEEAWLQGGWMLVFAFLVFFTLINIEKNSMAWPLMKLTLSGYFSYSTAQCLYFLWGRQRQGI